MPSTGRKNLNIEYILPHEANTLITSEEIPERRRILYEIVYNCLPNWKRIGQVNSRPIKPVDLQQITIDQIVKEKNSKGEFIPVIKYFKLRKATPKEQKKQFDQILWLYNPYRPEKGANLKAEAYIEELPLIYPLPLPTWERLKKFTEILTFKKSKIAFNKRPKNRWIGTGKHRVLNLVFVGKRFGQKLHTFNRNLDADRKKVGIERPLSSNSFNPSGIVREVALLNYELMISKQDPFSLLIVLVEDMDRSLLHIIRRTLLSQTYDIVNHFDKTIDLQNNLRKEEFHLENLNIIVLKFNNMKEYYLNKVLQNGIKDKDLIQGIFYYHRVRDLNLDSTTFDKDILSLISNFPNRSIKTFVFDSNKTFSLNLSHTKFPLIVQRIQDEITTFNFIDLNDQDSKPFTLEETLIEFLRTVREKTLGNN